MPLVSPIELLRTAAAEGWAVGAFNADNLELVQAIVGAAEAAEAPVILQATEGALSYAGFEALVGLMRAAGEAAHVPVAVHLDHGSDPDLIVRCLDAGFTSVMFDGSRLPFETNVCLTRSVVEKAHARRIAVEGELGHVGTCPDEGQACPESLGGTSPLTDPGEAEVFARETAVDFLAVAVGTVHGARTASARIDRRRLREIARRTGVPLVLHGASGVREDELVAAVRLGVAKVNTATRVTAAYADAMWHYVAQHPSTQSHREILRYCRDAAQREVAARIRIIGSSRKARR
jgi:fructose-bisphosphate aldolase class II